MDRSLHILHLEDDPLDAQLVRATLEDAGLSCDVLCVETRDRFEAALRGGGLDLVLSDYTLPMYDGRTALATSLELCPDVPFILVSGTVGEEAAIVGLLAGATDYVLKQHLSRLVPAVQRALREADNRRARREAEAALKASEQRYRRLFEASKDGLLLLDATSGAVVDANPSLLALLGRPRAELVGRPVTELGLAVEVGALEKVLHALHTVDVVQLPDLRLVTRGGATLNVELVATTYVEGVLKLIQCSIRDITARRRLEEELRQAQKMEAFGQVAGGVAHDFKNLLTVVQGNVALLQGMLSSAPAPARECLTEIAGAAERGTALTSQLLLFSRRRPAERGTIDLSVVAADFSRMLRRVLGESVTLELHGAPGAMVRADAGMMEQVLMNLAINARDAMPSGGRLRIDTAMVDLGPEVSGERPRRRPGRFVKLSVADSGCGIAPELVPRIFEPFFTTKAAGQGSGLGLATLYGIVEQHEGWVEVESQVGVGSTFSVFLPFAAPSDAVDRPSGVEAAPPEQGGASPVSSSGVAAAHPSSNASTEVRS